MALDPAGRRELHWSHGEKKAARAAFDNALARETVAIRKEVEALLKRSAEPNAIWDVHELLSKKLRELQAKYDYRYSVLISIFGRLLSEGWLSEADLADLSPEKMELIRRIARLAKELDA
jgi:hypothetical protein